MKRHVLWIVIFTQLVSAAPRSRIVGPRTDPPSAPAFQPDVAVWDLWTLSFEPEDAKVVVTISATDAPWSDPMWLSSNPRYANGAITFPLWRLRGGSRAEDIRHCKVGEITFPAERYAEMSAEVPRSSFQQGDRLGLESWAGLKITVTTYAESGLKRFETSSYRVAPTQPNWTQQHSIMGCSEDDLSGKVTITCPTCVITHELRSIGIWHGHTEGLH